MEPDERQDAYQSLVERRNILIHRRRLLEKQRDILGATVPAGVLIQLEQTQREIELVEGQIRYLDLDPKTVELAGDTGWRAALSMRVERLERDMRAGIGMVFDEIAADREERLNWRKQESEDRRLGQLKTRLWLIFLTLGQIAGLVLMGAMMWILLQAVHSALVAKGY